MVALRLLPAFGVALCLGCSGEFVSPIADGSTDSTTADAREDVLVPDATADAQGDSAWWFAQFDAQPFDNLLLPVIGEYPPPTGKPGGGCAPLANNGELSGWCCSGVVKAQGCVCGNSLGCLPPQICCYLPDHFVPECAPNLGACPNYNTPWNPGGFPPDAGGQ